MTNKQDKQPRQDDFIEECIAQFNEMIVEQRFDGVDRYYFTSYFPLSRLHEVIRQIAEKCMEHGKQEGAKGLHHIERLADEVAIDIKGKDVPNSVYQLIGAIEGRTQGPTTDYEKGFKEGKELRTREVVEMAEKQVEQEININEKDNNFSLWWTSVLKILIDKLQENS